MTHRSTPQDNQNLSETKNALRLPKAAGSTPRGKKTSRKKVEMDEERHRSRTFTTGKRNYNKNSADTIKRCLKPESRLNYRHECAVGRTKFKPERPASLRRRRSSRSVSSFGTVVSKIGLFFGKLMPHNSTHDRPNKDSKRPVSAFVSNIPPKILIDPSSTPPMNNLHGPNYGYKQETSQLFSFETSNQNTSSMPPDDNENAKKQEEKKKKKKKVRSAPLKQDSISEIKNAVTEDVTAGSTKMNTKQATKGDEEPRKDINEKSSSDVRHIPVTELESFKVGSTKHQEVQKNTEINASGKAEAEGTHKHHKHPHHHHENKHKKDEDEGEVIKDGKNKHHKRAKSGEKEEQAQQLDEERKHNKSHPLNSEVESSSEEGVVNKKTVKAEHGKHHKSRVDHKSKKNTQGEESVGDSTSDLSLSEKQHFRVFKDHERYETYPYGSLRRKISRRRDLIPPGSYASRRRRADLYDSDLYDELDKIFDDRMGSRMRCMNDYGSEYCGRRGSSYDECNYSTRYDGPYSRAYSMPTRSERGCCPETGSVACRCAHSLSECHSGRACTCNSECYPASKKDNSKLGGELLDALNEICSEIENRRRNDTYICVKQPKPCRTIYTPTFGHCLPPDSFTDDNDYSAYFKPPSRHRYSSDYVRGLPPRPPRREYDSDTESRERPKHKSSAPPSSTSSQPPQVPVLTPCPVYYPVPTPSCPPAQPPPAPQVNWCTPAIPASQPVGVVVRPTSLPVVLPGQCNPVSTYCPPCVIPTSAPQIVQPANVCLPTTTYYQRL